jgi:hypothetical protein
MRKFLWVVAVGALVLALTVPAMALDFKFSSSNRFRLYSLDGIGAEPFSAAALWGVATSPMAKTTTNNVNQADLRFRPWFRVSDDNGNIVSELRLEIGDVVFGDDQTAAAARSSGGAVGADGVNVETKWAYIDMALPFGIPARLRGGIQPYFLPKGLVIDDDGSGLRIYGSVKPFSYDLWWLSLRDAPSGAVVAAPTAPFVGLWGAQGPANDDNDLIAVKVDLAVAPIFNPYLYGLYRHGTITFGPLATTRAPGSHSSEGWWIGTGATGKLGIVSYDLDFVWGSDEIYTGDNIGGVALAGTVLANVERRRGWVVDGGVELPVGPTAVGLRGMYATGDDGDISDNTIEDFPGIRRPGDSVLTGSRASYTPKGAELFWASAGNGLFGCCTFQGDPRNTWTLGGYITYTPVKALTLKFDYFYIGAPKGSTNFYTGKKTIGHELALTATYQLWTGTKAWGLAGVIIPPERGNELVYTLGPTGTTVDLKTVQAFAFGIQHDF